jgi:hypothetical protein
MKILLPDGSEAPTEMPDQDAILGRKDAWAAIDAVIAGARQQWGEKWMDGLAERRQQLIVTLLPASREVWRIFLGEVAPDPRRQGGSTLLRVLGDAALQVLIQFRCDMLEGERIAQEVLAQQPATETPAIIAGPTESQSTHNQDTPAGRARI